MKDNIKIIDSKMHHCGIISRNMVEKKNIFHNFNLRDVHSFMIRNFKNSVICKTAFLNDQIIAMGGLESNLCSDTSLVWLAVNDSFHKVKISAIKEIKNTFRSIFMTKNDIICYVNRNDKKSIKFAEFLGFEMCSWMDRDMVEMIIRRR